MILSYRIRQYLHANDCKCASISKKRCDYSRLLHGQAHHSSCGVKCQKEHRSEHKRACKKRAAELREEILFKQPESSHRGDCPICCLPLPLDSKAILIPCCCKVICDGCDYANVIREWNEKLDHKCPFCRHPAAKAESEIEGNRNLMKRVEANDPAAIRYVGSDCESEGDYSSAFGYYSKAAGLGDIEAHYDLSCMYRNGHGVEKDKKKQLHHLEEAAIGGHPNARHNLGVIENEHGRPDRALKHWIIAANMGHDGSLENVKVGFKGGLVSKEDFAAALRAHQDAVEETKSQQREAAEAARTDRVKKMSGCGCVCVVLNTCSPSGHVYKIKITSLLLHYTQKYLSAILITITLQHIGNFGMIFLPGVLKWWMERYGQHGEKAFIHG